MNWDAIGAIGEVLGSIGVLITIVYFGVQLNKTQVSMRISIAAGIAQARVDLNNQRLDYMDLLVRANAGDDVNEVERERLRSIYGSEAATMLFAFLNFRNLGHDGQIQARNFARFLRDNPALEGFWELENERGERYSGMARNVPWEEWIESVSGHLFAVKARPRVV